VKFYFSVRIGNAADRELKAGGGGGGGGVRPPMSSAQRHRVKVVKNKGAARSTQEEFDIRYGKRIRAKGSLIDVGVRQASCSKSGAGTRRGDQSDRAKENPAPSLRSPPTSRRDRRSGFSRSFGGRQGAVRCGRRPETQPVGLDRGRDDYADISGPAVICVVAVGRRRDARGGWDAAPPAIQLKVHVDSGAPGNESPTGRKTRKPSGADSEESGRSEGGPPARLPAAQGIPPPDRYADWGAGRIPIG